MTALQEKQIYIHYELAYLTHLYIELDYKDKTDSKFNFSQVLAWVKHAIRFSE